MTALYLSLVVDTNRRINMKKQQKKSELNVSDDATVQETSDETPFQYDAYTEQKISKQTSAALMTLLFYSALMFTLPFGAFFGTRHYLTEHSDWTDFAVTCVSVFAAVATTYIIIGLYAWQAYREKDVVIPGEENTTSIEDTKKEK